MAKNKRAQTRQGSREEMSALIQQVGKLICRRARRGEGHGRSRTSAGQELEHSR